jgi:hypothetical protein
MRQRGDGPADPGHQILVASLPRLARVPGQLQAFAGDPVDRCLASQGRCVIGAAQATGLGVDPFGQGFREGGEAFRRRPAFRLARLRRQAQQQGLQRLPGIGAEVEAGEQALGECLGVGRKVDQEGHAPQQVLQRRQVQPGRRRVGTAGEGALPSGARAFSLWVSAIRSGIRRPAAGPFGPGDSSG